LAKEYAPSGEAADFIAPIKCVLMNDLFQQSAGRPVGAVREWIASSDSRIDDFFAPKIT